MDDKEVIRHVDQLKSITYNGSDSPNSQHEFGSSSFNISYGYGNVRDTPESNLESTTVTESTIKGSPSKPEIKMVLKLTYDYSSTDPHRLQFYPLLKNPNSGDH